MPVPKYATEARQLQFEREVLERLQAMDDWNQHHHGNNGLIERVRLSPHDEAGAEQIVDHLLSAFVGIGQGAGFLQERFGLRGEVDVSGRGEELLETLLHERPRLGGIRHFPFRKLFALALLLALGIAGPADSQSLPFAPGERLTYGARIGAVGRGSAVMSTTPGCSQSTAAAAAPFPGGMSSFSHRLGLCPFSAGFAFRLPFSPRAIRFR